MERKGVILLVEDNEALSAANSRALSMRGYETQSAPTLAEARQRLAETEPDIILLDVMMPDGDGFLFCEEIREKTAEELYAKAWAQPMNEDKNALQATISRVRKKIENSGYSIDFIRGQGYIFRKK